MTLLSPNIKVVYEDFGVESVRGFVTTIRSGYLIGINSRLSEEEQQNALEHEISHIIKRHLDPEDKLTFVSVSQIETEAHN